MKSCKIIKPFEESGDEEKAPNKIKVWVDNAWHHITYPFRNFFRKSKRIIDFFPIIWKGHDFDYRYAIDLFQYQLERIADHLESDKAWSVEAKNDAKRIRTAIKLMKKVYDDEYGVEYQEVLEKKYGPSDFSFKPVEDSPDLKEMELFYGKTNSDDIKEEVNELLLKSMEKQKKAERILWKLIGRNIRGWWD
jgi:hypothetical protein